MCVTDFVTDFDDFDGHGMTRDEVLAALRTAGYYDCIGRTHVSATIQLISHGDEVQDDGEFLLRYNRVLDF